MPRRAKPPRLYLRARQGREPTWYLVHGNKQFSTGFIEHERNKAEETLSLYLARPRVVPPKIRRLARDKRLAEIGELYFLEAKGLAAIKVGFSANLTRRLHELRTSLPIDLILVASIQGRRAMEAEAHAALAPHRVRGEWFKAEAALAYLAELRAKQ